VRNELDTLCVSRMSLFPDLQGLGDYITERFDMGDFG
jgi:hypothetical protein